MRSPYPLQHRLAGILLCVLGTICLLGWIIGSEVLVRVVPSSPAVAINTAVMFLLSGTCLLSAARGGRFRRLYLCSAGALILLPLAILSQHILGIDLGIDLAEFHTALGDGHSKPGRTAPNACLGFLFAGLVFVFSRDETSRLRHRRLNLTLSGLTLAIGIMSLLGYLLQLESMYRLATYNRMATLTALGITTLGVGLWSLSSSMTAGKTDDSALGQARRITRLSASLLTAFALIAGLTGFAILRQGFEESSRENLSNTAKTNAFVISSELKHGMLVSRSIANRTILKRYLSRLETPSNDDTALQSLRDVGEMLIDSGFSGIQIFDAENRLVVTEGNVVADEAEGHVPISSEHNATLFWRGEFLLRSELDVIQNGKRIGGVVTELPLIGVTEFMAEARRVGSTYDVVLCGRVENEAACFPSRFRESATRFPLFTRGGSPAFSISRALLGEMGAETTTDVHGDVVQAGFAPLPDYGLGLMVRKEVIELYAPLRDRLHLLIVVLFGFVCAGTLLLRKWVQPLVEQIISEQRRMKAILNNSNDAFVGIGSNGLVSDWNFEAEEMLGWTADEAIGQDLDNLIIPPDQREASEGGWSRFLSSDDGPVVNQRIEVLARHKSGREIPVELSVASFHSGADYGSSVFLRDLTDLKAAERMAIEHSQELETARAALVQAQKLEAVGKLTGGVAHDFNNVLQVIRGTLQLLQLEDIRGEKAKARVSTAMNAVDRGAKLSAQLLAFARKQPLQPKVINLASVIHSMTEMLQQALGDTIDVKVLAAEGLWNTIADPSQLENVILNLAINARDAMQGQGKLTIEVSNAVLDEEYAQSEPEVAAGQFVMLAISDTGPGMPEDVRERVFEPFFTTKSEGEGTGLGLSMAHGFIKQSEGHIRIYSEVGHGTTFKIYFPRCFEREAQATSPTPGATDGGSETILVVEDDLAVQATVVDMLTGLGYNVLKADNAEEALHIVKKNRTIDLLFTDVVMPGSLRSPDLARQAEKLIPKLKVLFTSGYTQDAIVHGGRLDPGVHLLSKPYGRDQLARKVRELLSFATDGDRSGEDSAAPAVQVAQASSLKIAFVEDNDDFRALVSEMLAMMEYRVESFASAESAISSLKDKQFDVLLTDVSLPGMSGVELASIAYEADPGIQIILASGYGNAIAENAEFPFVLLSKPFSIEQLKSCLNAFEGKRAPTK